MCGSVRMRARKAVSTCCHMPAFHLKAEEDAKEGRAGKGDSLASTPASSPHLGTSQSCSAAGFFSTEQVASSWPAGRLQKTSRCRNTWAPQVAAHSDQGPWDQSAAGQGLQARR